MRSRTVTINGNFYEPTLQRFGELPVTCHVADIKHWPESTSLPYWYPHLEVVLA